MSLILATVFLIMVVYILIFFLFSYLYIVERKKHFKILLLSCFLNFINCFFYYIYIRGFFLNEKILFIQMLLSVISSFFLFWGINILLERTFSRKWLYLALIFIALCMILSFNNCYKFIIFLFCLTKSFFYGCIGRLLFSLRRKNFLINKILSFCFILWSLHILFYPFYYKDPSLFSLACFWYIILLIITACGSILLYFEEKREQIYNHSLHDIVTGLPNRVLFENIFNSLNKDRIMGLFVVNINHFEKINVSLGYAFGDKLLRKITEKLKNIISKKGFLAKLGGDKFCVLLNVKRQTEIFKIIDIILSNFDIPFIIEGYKLLVSIKIGISIYPNDSKDITTLIRDAEVALDFAKETNENYIVFSSELTMPSIKDIELINDLKCALERKELLIYYQPLINIKTGKIKGFEALSRWQHPDLGLLSPDIFIPLAEESGLILKIDEYVLKNACMDIKKLIGLGLEDFRIAINLSAQHFQKEYLPEFIHNLLQEIGVEPEFLEFEITESTLIQNIDFAIKILEELNKIGIRISIDDFGTGYSSLNYLSQMTVNSLKIDKSFVQNIFFNTNNQAIIKAIIAMAKNLDLKITAEGVETYDQYQFLQEHNCDIVQGYLFSKPLPFSQLEKKLLIKGNNLYMANNKFR